MADKPKLHDTVLINLAKDWRNTNLQWGKIVRTKNHQAIFIVEVDGKEYERPSHTVLMGREAKERLAEEAEARLKKAVSAMAKDLVGTVPKQPREYWHPMWGPMSGDTITTGRGRVEYLEAMTDKAKDVLLGIAKRHAALLVLMEQSGLNPDQFNDRIDELIEKIKL